MKSKDNIARNGMSSQMDGGETAVRQRSMILKIIIYSIWKDNQPKTNNFECMANV